jgi:hypothetical protein
LVDAHESAVTDWCSLVFFSDFLECRGSHLIRQFLNQLFRPVRQETFPDCFGYRFNRDLPAIDRKGVGDAGVGKNLGKNLRMFISPFIIG